MGQPALTALLLLLCSYAAVADEPVVRRVQTPIGKLYIYDVSADAVLNENELPKWLHITTNGTNKYLGGIPQPNDFGSHIVDFGNDQILDIDVIEEMDNPCGNEISLWIDIFKAQDMADISYKNQTSFIMEQATNLDNNASNFRLYPMAYLQRVRHVDHVVMNQADESQNFNYSSVLTWPIGCKELDEDGILLVGVITENAEPFRVVQGRIKAASSRDPLIKSTTPMPKSTTKREARYTDYPRWNSDHPPTKVNSLKSYSCKRGHICRIEIPDNVFFDIEEGTTRNLKLTVYPIGKNVNFLASQPGTTLLRGIPLEVGEFQLRLEARDRSNQTASAPFTVKVEDGPEVNHEYQMTLYKPSNEEHSLNRPEVVLEFVDTLTKALNSKPGSVRINSLSTDDEAKTVTVTWSNTSISRSTCNKKAADAVLQRMAKGAQTRTEFYKEMGERFQPKHVALNYTGNCVAKKVQLVKESDKTIVSADEKPQPITNASEFLPIVLIGLLVLFLALFLVCCVIHHKKRNHKKKNGDYVSKGLPVVFPEEVPHDEENITVSTPMLASHEHPPFDPKMTLHENPLYKPKAAPLSFQSPVHASPSPQRASAAAVPIGQRHPPPYTATS